MSKVNMTALVEQSTAGVPTGIPIGVSNPQGLIPALTPEQMADLHRRLAAEQARLLGRVGEETDHTRADWNPDRGDLALSASSRERRMALQEMDTEKLDQVEAALLRMENGTYGRCDTCGTPIHPERLEIIPAAALCANCQAS